jgi:hypothetical protein
MENLISAPDDLSDSIIQAAGWESRASFVIMRCSTTTPDVRRALDLQIPLQLEHSWFATILP